MNRKISLYLLLGIACIGTLFSQSWFPEGSTAAVGDNERRSLQKINSLLHTGAGSTAPATNTATLMTWNSGGGSVTTTAVGVGTNGGFNGTVLARRALLKANATNTADVTFSPFAGNGRSLSAGQEYVLEGPPGTVFNLNGWRLVTTGSQMVDVDFCY